MSTLDYMLLGLLVLMYLFMCVRVAMAAPALDRSAVRWFFISLLLTAIPALIVFSLEIRRRRRQLLDQLRRQSQELEGRDLAAADGGSVRRCVQCGRFYLPDQRPPQERDVCPHCHLKSQGSDIA